MQNTLIVVGGLILWAAPVSVGREPAQEVAVLSFRQPQTYLHYYRMASTGQAKLYSSVALQNFAREVTKGKIGTRSFIYRRRLLYAVLSPDRRYLACGYQGAKLEGDEGPGIRIYDLRLGKKIRSLPPSHSGGDFVWCRWERKGVLRYLELYQDAKDREHFETGLYEVGRGRRTLVSHRQMEEGENRPDPSGYNILTEWAAAVFWGLKVIGPLTYESGGFGFEGQFLGMYRSNSSNGAVSADGDYAIGETFEEGRIRYYVLINVKAREKLGEIEWPLAVRVQRLTFLDHQLLASLQKEGRGIVEIWSAKQVKKIGSLDGDYLVDWDRPQQK